MTRTIDDLRATFSDHADELADTALPGRSAAVAGRVTTVRRQRRAVVGAGLAAVLVAAALGVTTLHRRDGAQPAGVPERVDVYGFGYRLDRTIAVESGRTGLTARLPVGDRDYALVLVGTGLGSGDATLWVDGQPAERATGDEVSSAYPVDATVPTDLRVRLSGAPAGAQASVAVYERTDQLPAGIVGDGRVYRQRVGSATLLGGAFGERGQAEVSFSLDADGHWGISEECTTPAKDAWLQVEVDGKPAWAEGCGAGDGGRAPTDAASAIQGDDGGAGHHTVRLYVTRGQRSTTPLVAPGTRISAAAYDQSDSQVVDRMRLGRVTEFAGRDWEISRVVPVPAGARSLTRTITTGDEPVRVAFIVRSGSAITLRARAAGHPADDQEDGIMNSSGGVSMGSDKLLLPHDTYTVSMTPQDARRADLHGALVIYRPTD